MFVALVEVIVAVAETTVMAEMVASQETDPGGWLVAHRWEMDRGESSWLQALAVFDRDQGWAVDGQLNGADWLVWQTDMARATAYEKLRIAHQLSRRPLLAAAFTDGRLSYSAVRAIARIDDPDPETDRALINVAVAGSVADVERVVRAYQLHADQHRSPSGAADRRGVRIIRGYDGTGRVEVTLSDVELEEFACTLQAFLDHHRPVDESARADSESPGPVDESARADSGGGRQPEPSRRADAFMDLTRTALANGDGGAAAGGDRYLVHVVLGPEGTELADGTPLAPEAAERIACDCSIVTHHTGPAGEPLALGRKTRVWSTAQRRAALVRDAGHCRFPGCRRRINDLHHQLPWDDGGPTDIDNGFLACPHHHTLLHAGYRATGNPNRELTFHRPDQTILGTSRPQRHRSVPAGGFIARGATGPT